MNRHPLRGYLDQLKSRVTGGNPTQNCYSYAEVPDWAIRQAMEVHGELVDALTEIAKAKGPFKRDRLAHAEATIEHMVETANRAIAHARLEREAAVQREEGVGRG